MVSIGPRVARLGSSVGVGSGSGIGSGVGLALVLWVTTGCGGGEPADPDAAPISDAATPGPDADQRVCEAAGDCACFSNADCPATTRCHALDDSGAQVWCLPGDRGAGGLGVACTVDDDCASALCVEDSEATLRCSILCDTDDDCGDTLADCLFIGFGVDESICAPA